MTTRGPTQADAPRSTWLADRTRLPVPFAWLTAGILGAILLSHAGLIPAGHWEGDEWLAFSLFRVGGVGFVTHRVLVWSPRPVSETMVFLYARAVAALHQPLIGPMLGLCWAALAGSAAVIVPLSRPSHRQDAGTDRHGHTRNRRLACVLLALAVLVFFLLGHQVAEMFYWPMGAAAYMGALAGLTLLAMLLLRGRHLSRGGTWLAAGAMAAAIGSAEVGAMAVGACSVLLGAVELRRRHLLRAALSGIPLALSLLILALILNGRGAAGVALGSETATIHALWPSLRAAAAQFAHETLSLDAQADGTAGIAIGIAVKVALFCGMRELCRVGLHDSPTPAAHLWCLAAALPTASFLSIVAAYWQFGLVCCQRHESFRQCLDVLTLLMMAAIAARSQTSPGLLERFGEADALARLRLARGSACLLLAAGLALAHRGPLMTRVPALWSDYRSLPAMLAARQRIWDEGGRAGSEMLFQEPPRGFVVGGIDWQDGVFARAADPPWHMLGIMLFYGKQRIIFKKSA